MHAHTCSPVHEVESGLAQHIVSLSHHGQPLRTAHVNSGGSYRHTKKKKPGAAREPQPSIFEIFSEGWILSTGTGTSGSGSGLSSHASQTATDSDVSLLTSIDSGLSSGVEEDSDIASDAEIVWAKGPRGVCGLANVFANGKLYFTRDVPEATWMPQGLEPPAKPAAKPAPKSSIKSAAKPAAGAGGSEAAAKPAAGEPLPVTPC